MLNLYNAGITKKKNSRETLDDGEKFSVYYHDLFDYPLTFSDLIKWGVDKPLPLQREEIPIIRRNGFFMLQGKEGLAYKRILRERISAKKLEIAVNTAKILLLIPTVKLIAVTGSLAMANASEESDIDILIVTAGGRLWTTRILAYVLLRVLRIRIRHPGDSKQRDKLCLNMWMDEADLVWRSPQNTYTAHEIVQIVPLVNKDRTYEKFLWENRWVLKYWPNAVKLSDPGVLDYRNPRKTGSVSSFLEKLAYLFQCRYMKSKITREVISPTRAIFHPQDWGKIVLARLTS